MAVFKLGALITDIVGSIGGTTFKRQGSSMVIMRKSNGASKGSTGKNVRLQNNFSIFRSWNALPEEDKRAWNANATATKVKDKFGNNVYISGVAFQRKCELSGQVFDYSNINPRDFNTDIKPFILGDCNIDWTPTDLKIFFNAPEGMVKVALMLEFSQKNLNSPQFTRRGVFNVFEADGDSSYTVGLLNFPQFAFLNDNYNLRVYAYTCNPTGWTSTQQYKDVISST